MKRRPRVALSAPNCASYWSKFYTVPVYRFLCVEKKEDGPEKKGVTLVKCAAAGVWTVVPRRVSACRLPRPRAGLVTPQQACYKGFVMLYELASFVTKLVTKLVMHYEYIARNEARYEARNAAVWTWTWTWAWAWAWAWE